jgi:transcriptional regulator with XRE-family HTH domain
LTIGKSGAIIKSLVVKGVVVMIVRTRIFELRNGNYKNLSQLAQAMGISVSQIYRVREGKRSINQKFIIGAIKAFPECRLDELFYLAPENGGGNPGGEAPGAKSNRYAWERFDLAGRRPSSTPARRTF